METFAGTLEQIIDDPIIVLESVAQSISDTSEKEGIMYVTGGAATSLIPYVGQSKYLNRFSFAFAVKEFLECKGTHYDPVMIDSFMRGNGTDILNVKIINK